ncbi:hypothetical protein AC028_08740 [Xanthomonas citri pv. aurantifolii]|nr:hypothetical protein AC028_08740 [Xanthomonas citri pv. aurantifolii]
MLHSQTSLFRPSLGFTINAKDALRLYDEQRKAYVVDPGAYEVQIGASSADIRARQRFTVTDK